MLDISDVLASLDICMPKREDRFCVSSEDDGKGCVVVHKNYIYNPKRKSRPMKIPVRYFLATAINFVDGIYEAHYLPPEKKENPQVYKRRFKRLKKYLKDYPMEENIFS
jgi:hypothetical protein